MTIAILETHAFDGPSLWLDRPVVRVIAAGASSIADAGRLLESLELLGGTLDVARYTPFPLAFDACDVAVVAAQR